MLPAREPPKSPDVFDEGDVADNSKAKRFPNPDKNVGVRKAVKGKAKAVVLHHPHDLGESWCHPARIIVSDNRLLFAVPAPAVIDQIRRIS